MPAALYLRFLGNKNDSVDLYFFRMMAEFFILLFLTLTYDANIVILVVKRVNIHIYMCKYTHIYIYMSTSTFICTYTFTHVYYLSFRDTYHHQHNMEHILLFLLWCNSQERSRFFGLGHHYTQNRRWTQRSSTNIHWRNEYGTLLILCVTLC